MALDSQDPTLNRQLSTKLASFDLTEVIWFAPELLSVFEVARSVHVDASLAAAAKAKITALAETLLTKSRASPYRMLEANGELSWESVETMLHRADALFMAYEITGNTDYLSAASAQVDWIVGENALDQSFVTAHGNRSPVHPYHWTTASMGIVMPGWAVGGPNPVVTGADPLLVALQKRGTPPAKCYVDEGLAGSGSWASNEGEVSEEAALVYAAGTLRALGQSGKAWSGTATGSGGPSGAGGSAGGGSANSSGNANRGCSCTLTLPEGRASMWTSLWVGMVGFALVVLRRRANRLAARPRACDEDAQGMPGGGPSGGW